GEMLNAFVARELAPAALRSSANTCEGELQTYPVCRCCDCCAAEREQAPSPQEQCQAESLIIASIQLPVTNGW
ncbi:hypothetical protein, partial [Pseudomonas sp. Sample_24]|uniref:hypothetical protein n=1 Tax=Pseudomonas sp. Sample_24 TaxID=2448268 RepID=UPI0019D65ABE